MTAPTTPETGAAPAPSAPKKLRYFRWSAILPLSVFLVLLVLWTWIFKDPVARWAVETAGTAAVGAKVDLARAHVSLTQGDVRLEGLAVTNPNAPMTNLFEVDELIFDVGVLAALEKKIVIDTMAARGLRFNTARATSGAVPQEEQSEESQFTSQVIDDWKSRIKIPPLDLNTLRQTVNVEAISADSLATLRAALQARGWADTVQQRFTADLRAADPRPTLDSAEALVARLRNASLQSLGLAGVRREVANIRRTLDDIKKVDDRLKALETKSKANVDTMTRAVQAISAAKTQDYAYARGLLKLPTFDIPSIGPQLMSDLVAEQLGPVLYWVKRVEQYTPPGLKRQTQPGPKRVRASGTDVLFPKETVYPTFLMRLAELSLTLGGEGSTAGDYAARLEGVTTQPSVYGLPTRFAMSRTGSNAEARDINVRGALDHRTDVARDSIAASLSGIALPRIPLGGLGATVQLNKGLSQLNLQRVGDSLTGNWLWRAPKATWVRDTAATSASGGTNVRGRVEDALWRAMSRLDSVEIEARVGGTLSHPTLGVRTNIANALGNALREELGDEVRRAEAQVRARVDALVDAKVAEARTQVDKVRTEAETRIAAERARLEQQKKDLEAKLRDLVRIPGVG